MSNKFLEIYHPVLTEHQNKHLLAFTQALRSQNFTFTIKPENQKDTEMTSCVKVWFYVYGESRQTASGYNFVVESTTNINAKKKQTSSSKVRVFFNEGNTDIEEFLEVFETKWAEMNDGSQNRHSNSSSSSTSPLIDAGNSKLDSRGRCICLTLSIVSLTLVLTMTIGIGIGSYYLSR